MSGGEGDALWLPLSSLLRFLRVLQGHQCGPNPVEALAATRRASQLLPLIVRVKTGVGSAGSAGSAEYVRAGASAVAMGALFHLTRNHGNFLQCAITRKRVDVPF